MYILHNKSTIKGIIFSQSQIVTEALHLHMQNEHNIDFYVLGTSHFCLLDRKPSHLHRLPLVAK